MAKNVGRIGLGIDFNVNTASLNQVKSALAELKKMSATDIQKAGGTPWIGDTKNMKKGVADMRAELSHLEQALEKAYNPKLGTFEVSKFNQAINTTEHSARLAFQALQDMGAGGSRLAMQLSSNMLAVDRAAKQTSSTIKKLGETMMNTIRWSITSNAVNMVTGALQQAYGYAVDLDQSLNDIRIVTEKSSDEMERFARSANKAAKNLGASTRDYTDASLIYYQQGLSDAEVSARTETTLKAAAITGQSADAVSEQLTAVWNGYKVSADEAEVYIDKLSAVAATTAADLEELSTGMSKVASAANVMGVDADQLNAQLATIVSVTREAPESIGTALKTVYARMSDIEAGIDTETTLGEYTSQMAQMGINVLDANEKLRDMGAVVEEIGNKWNTLNREQQVSLAQSIAGTRQYSRMMALFDNWDMYQSALTTSLDSAGALSRQHAIYLESIEAHQNKLKASAEGLYDSIFDSNEIKGVYDALSGIVTMVDHLVQSLGGMPGILTLALSIFTKISKNSIAELVTRQKINKLHQKQNEIQIQGGLEYIGKQKETLTKKETNIDETLRNKELTLSTVGADTKEGQQLKTEIARLRLQKNVNAEHKKFLDLEKQVYEAAQKGQITNERWQEIQQTLEQVNQEYLEYTELQEKQIQIQSQRKGDYSKVKLSGVLTEEGKPATYDLTNETWRENAKNALLQERAILGGEGGRTSTAVKGSITRIDNEITKLKKDPVANAEKIAKLEEKRVKLEEKRVKLKNIENDEQRIREIEEQLKLEKEINDELERKERIQEANKGTLKTEEETLKLEQFGQRIADITEGLTSVIFTATAVSSSIVDITEKTKEGTASFEDWLGVLGVIGMSVVPMVTSSITSMKSALNGGKVSTLAGAAAWQFYWSAATMGAAVLITILTTVFSLIKSSNEALKEGFKNTIEESNKAIEEAKKISDLATSYLDLYEAYKKTGEGKESLDSATEALLDAYESEDFQLLKQIGDYEKLAEEIDNVRNKKKLEALEKAREKKTAAEDILDTKTAGNTAGIAGGASGKDAQQVSIFWSGFSSTDEDDKKNEVLIKEALGEDFHYINKTTSGHNIEFIMPKTAEGKVDLYNRLTAAKETMEEEEQTDGEYYKNLVKFLDDADWTSATKDINDANKEIQSGEVWEQVKAFGDNTSLSNFHDERERLISETMQKTGGDRDLAAALVDQQLQEYNSNTRNLLARERSILAFEKYDGLNSELAGGLREKNANISDAAFSALSTLDLENFSGSADDLIKKAQEKAIELQDATWTAFGEERLKSLKKGYNDLGRAIDKSLGKDKINLIKEQNTNLEKQSEILKAISEDQQKDFEKKKADFKEKTGIDYTNPEQAKLSIEKLYNEGKGVINEDQYAEYLTLLKSVTSAENTYNDALTDVAENQEEIYQNNIKIYETEIESIDARIEKYQNLIDTLQSIADVYKLMYGENDFSKLTRLYNQQLENAKLVQAQALSKIKEYQTQLADSTLDDVTRDDIALKLQDALKSGVDAVKNRLELAKEAFVNSVNAALQTSMEKATGKSTAYAENEWKYKVENSEKYLDNVQKAYKIETLERDVLERINKLTNSNTRTRVNKALQTELDILQKRDKLTEADVARAERKIKLLEAEIALEEARENKNQMRLIRGADGTYGYQYVADQNAINEREKAVRDQRQENYNAAKNEYMDNVTETSSMLYDIGEQLKTAADDETRKQILAQNKERITAVLTRNQELKAEAQALGIDTASINQTWFDSLANGGLNTFFADVNGAMTQLEEELQLEDTNDILKEILGYAESIATADTSKPITKWEIKDNEGQKTIEAASAATGMYTGEWGPEGKVAILHEKELVLNKEDTANILRAVDLVRSLRSSMLDTVAGMGRGYEMPMAAWELAREMVIEQTVNINAEFPNATDRSEIEAAFDELILLATQHAYEDVRGR